MITRVSANKPSFKTIEFSRGFNVVWADRTKDSTKKDSRNGLGKSTLIEIMHFCLGANVQRGKGLAAGPLAGWEFSLELQIGDRQMIVSRGVDRPGVVTVAGDMASLPIPPRLQDGRKTYAIKDWNVVLGNLMFGLPVDGEQRKYQPTFRSLISYFMRRQKDAFSTPFEHHRKQVEWDKQINNAFLLGLAWEDASALQELKDRKKALDDFKKAAQSGIVKGFLGSLGDLEARKVQLRAQADHESASLASFRVHLQYKQIQAEANRLTEEIHLAVNASTKDTRLLEVYQQSLAQEQAPAHDSIERIYKEAGVSLPGVALRRLEEVQNFHTSIIENRRSFLAAEMDRLRRAITSREGIIEAKTRERASVMEVLKTHGALEEYTLLQQRHMDTISKLNEVSAAIGNLKAFESGLSDLKIEQEILQQKARRDYDERNAIRERAIALFNSYSERLYNAPGKLVLDVGPNGFKFDVEIERAGSTGISNMKVFCYDLMLACLWSKHTPSPRLLVHDSLIFDGVDERQRALALETAAKEATANGFQYICALNSDYVPWSEFSSDFDLRKYFRVTLTDESADGCLLGIRF